MYLPNGTYFIVIFESVGFSKYTKFYTCIDIIPYFTYLLVCLPGESIHAVFLAKTHLYKSKSTKGLTNNLFIVMIFNTSEAALSPSNLNMVRG